MYPAIIEVLWVVILILTALLLATFFFSVFVSVLRDWLALTEGTGKVHWNPRADKLAEQLKHEHQTGMAYRAAVYRMAEVLNQHVDPLMRQLNGDATLSRPAGQRDADGQLVENPLPPLTTPQLWVVLRQYLNRVDPQ